MENLFYSIKEQELIIHDAKKQPLIIYVKYAIWGIILFLIICSLIFKDNFFLEINRSSFVILIAMFLSTLFVRKKKVPHKSDFELKLYEDKLVLYRPRIIYGKRMIRKEENTILYSDLEKFVYKEKEKRCCIYGNINMCWTKYCKDNNAILENTPYKNTKINKTLLFFNTNYIDMDKFIKEVELHSKIKIIKE